MKIETLASLIIKVTIITIVISALIWIAIGVFAVKGAIYIKNNGMKKVAEKVWEGDK